VKNKPFKHPILLIGFGERLYDRLAEDLARRIEAERSHLALVASK